MTLSGINRADRDLGQPKLNCWDRLLAAVRRVLAPSSPLYLPAQSYDPPQLLMGVFLRLRNVGFGIGVNELLDALKAVEGGWAAGGPDALAQMARLLWCKSPADEHEFEEAWGAVAVELGLRPGDVRPNLPVDPLPGQASVSGQIGTPAPTATTAPTLPMGYPGWETLPVRAAYSPLALEGTAELHSYYPLSRRAMVYAWRYLRRPLTDGPQDVFDERATVAQTAQQGFYLGPVYRRRERNHAHLVLMLDQDGSMMPFHRFTRLVAETAQFESNIERVDVFYFHNLPAADLYFDPHRTMPVTMDAVLGEMSDDTSLLIVSDGGAARGYRRMERIRLTARWLTQLQSRTALLAWLNPMPANRWLGTSAQIIAHMAPMFQMDPDGLGSAVDIVRGQPR